MEDYKTGHRERLRTRAEDNGIDNMRSHEILELILCYAVPRVDMNETARILIRRFGSLKGVLCATEEELLSVDNVGKSVVEWLGITRELISAYAAMEPADQKQIFRQKDAIEYVLSFSEIIRPPRCAVIYTDFSKRILMKSMICDSLAWAEPEYIRHIITEAISLQAKNAILVLFTGPAAVEFDENDIRNLLNLARSLRAINVELLDCIIRSESDVISMNTQGAMDIIRKESRNIALHEDYSKEV